MEKIGVFCSASEQIDEKYFIAASQLGAWMGEHQMTLVYGGANCGLMGAIAREVKSHGGRLMGMVPDVLEERGLLQEDLDVIFPCEGLTDRKDLMIDMSDVLVALPGGIGTLDEVFTVMGQASIGLKNRPLYLLNIDGFWNPLVALIQHLKDSGFMRHDLSHYCTLVDSVDELVERFSSI